MPIIVDIYWERILLHIKFSAENLYKYFIYKTNKTTNEIRKYEIFTKTNIDSSQKTRIDSDQKISLDSNHRVNIDLDKKLNLDSNHRINIDSDQKINDEIIINMSTIDGRNFLSNGLWNIGYEKNGELIPFIINNEVAEKLENLDKVFKYNKHRNFYTVSFEPFSNDGKNTNLHISSLFGIKNSKWKKSWLFSQNKTIKAIIQKTKENILKFFYIVFVAINKLNSKKTILFINETTDELSGNLLFLYNRIKERGLDKKFNILISTRITIGQNNSFISWLKTMNKVGKAKYIFVDNYVALFTKLKLAKSQKIIQLWHAGVGFKGVGFMRFGKKGSPAPSGNIHKRYNYAIAPSKKTIHVFQEVFGIESDAFLPYGLPRMDGYLNEEKINNFRTHFYSKYPYLENKKIILFAPTYRGTSQRTAYYNYSQFDFYKINEYCKMSNSVLIVKMHHFIKDTKIYWKKYNKNSGKKHIDDDVIKQRLKPNFANYSNIIDLTNIYNINDLFYITDILITDYSSAIFEYSIFKKPIIFFSYDALIYENTRNTHVKIKNSPGKVTYKFDELLTALKQKDYNLEKTIKFSDNNFEGVELNGISDRIIDKVIEL